MQQLREYLDVSQAKSVTVNLAPGLTLLTIVFVLLKAFDKIDWSWWLVLAPTWVPFALAMGFIAVGCGLAILGALLK